MIHSCGVSWVSWGGRARVASANEMAVAEAPDTMDWLLDRLVMGAWTMIRLAIMAIVSIFLIAGEAAGADEKIVEDAPSGVSALGGVGAAGALAVSCAAGAALGQLDPASAAWCAVLIPVAAAAAPLALIQAPLGALSKKDSSIVLALPYGESMPATVHYKDGDQFRLSDGAIAGIHCRRLLLQPDCRLVTASGKPIVYPNGIELGFQLTLEGVPADGRISLPVGRRIDLSRVPDHTSKEERKGLHVYHHAEWMDRTLKFPLVADDAVLQRGVRLYMGSLIYLAAKIKKDGGKVDEADPLLRDMWKLQECVYHRAQLLARQERNRAAGRDVASEMYGPLDETRQVFDALWTAGGFIDGGGKAMTAVNDAGNRWKREPGYVRFNAENACEGV